MSNSTYNGCANRIVGWSAIFIGALVGVGLSFLLNLYCFALGLAAFRTSPEGVMGFTLGGFLGLAIGTIVAMFISGWITGYLARPYCTIRNLGSLYGFSAWSVALILMIMLAVPVNHFITSYFSILGNQDTLIVKVGSHNDAQPGPQMNLINVNPEEAITSTGKIGLTAFALFFLSALASCAGGDLSIRYKKDDDSAPSSSNPTHTTNPS